MRLTCMIVVGIVALGCKDPGPAKPAEPPAHATSGSATPATRPQARPQAPTLEADPSFDAETRDVAWANATEKAIHAVAPQLTDVTCRYQQCRGTVSAASEAALVEAMQKTDALRELDGATNVLLTRDGDGLKVTVALKFDRD
jgi:hypothetical protein